MNPSVHVLLLAGGRSSRTGGSHKLLATFDGVPLIRRSAETALRSRATGVTAVVGYRGGEIAAALSGLAVSIVENCAFADGLSTSLIAGFAAMPAEAEGALVMLADQPGLTSHHLDRLLDAFRPTGKGSLVVATHDGEWLNPVVISKLYDRKISEIGGDKGAKSLLRSHSSVVRAVEIGPAARLDVDTIEAIVLAGGTPENAERLR